MHKLLTRQLKRKFPSAVCQEKFYPFLDAISQAYSDFDNERDLLERSLNLVSQELSKSNEDLRTRILQLENTYSQLSKSAAVLDSILDATGESIVAINKKGTVIRCNQTAKNIFPWLSEDQTKSSNYNIKKILKLLKKPSLFVRELKAIPLEDRKELYGNLEFKDSRLFEYNSRPQTSGDELIGRVWCFREVTKIKENEALVEFMAFHDALTALPNRVLFLDRLNHAIKLAHGTDNLLAVLFVDLDHFKKVNDTAGHQYGDELLIEVAQRIQKCLREQDTLARFGGDEFVVLLENIKSHRIASAVSQRIIDNLCKPFKIQDKSFHISSSIGVTIFPRDDVVPEELIRKADMAMYHAKDNGRGNFEFFNTALERFAHFQLEMENKLRKAVRDESFEIYYQPQVDTKVFEVRGMEALIRWVPENGKPISPAEFIPLAERIGIISTIDIWVMKNVCKQIRLWLDGGLDDFRVSVNLSANQLATNYVVSEISRFMKEFSITGKYLEFEITESMLLLNLDRAIEVLRELRALGVDIAIDDFGTGYSSLQYLQKLPIDAVKIDRSFIRDFEQNKNNEPIVNTIIDLGHNLNLRVIAEGVEEQNSVDFLQRKKCDYIQGYFFYRPLRLDAMTKVLVGRKQ